MGIILHSVKIIKDKQSTNLGLANAGYCFIRFHNFEDASKVLNTFTGKPIPGTNNQRYFRLNWSSANVQAATVGIQPPPTTTTPEYSIFVGDLPQTVNEQILLQTFQSRYPSCSGVKVMIDQLTGHLKGYGFVKFLNEEEQKRSLIEMQGFILMGRPIRVSTAAKSSNGPGSNSMGGNIGGQQRQSGPSQISQQGGPRNVFPPLPTSVPLQYYNDPSNTTVFIGGLNVPITEPQLRDLFIKYGDITYVKIPAGKNCGFVQYYHRASAEMAITEMQGYDVGGGCKIRVSWGARAAQRNWFARQLALKQQSDNNGSPMGQFEGMNGGAATPPGSIGGVNSFMPPQSQPQDLTASLGLSGSNIPMNDMILDYSNSDLGSFNNEPIPFNRIGNSAGQQQQQQQSSITQSGDNTSAGSTEDFRLNGLLLSARDGNLDQIDLSSTVHDQDVHN
ncbi:unnamed protein product [Ambrosiozyma monospora]|uniref:Unnamed protein product n=1 Tax=Ambrosiozyma monospora TaxID=43982 RepID=A0A9W6Z7A3_AMBMO|nr:unnamed protein product [Ambrosiozyma monospora]